MNSKKPLTKSERMTKLYVKFYKQQRTLYLKQFKELAEFHEIEDRTKLEKKIKPFPLHDTNTGRTEPIT